MGKQRKGLLFLVIIGLTVLVSGTTHYSYSKDIIQRKIAIPAPLKQNTPTPKIQKITVSKNKIAKKKETRTACAGNNINLSDDFMDLTSKTGLITLIEETNYEIRGQTQGKVFHQLNNCTPFGSGKENDFGTAVTNSNINWKYDFTYAKGQVCKIKNIAVGLHINTIIPKWEPQPAADSRLINKWNKFILNLRTHENGHAEFAKKSANEIFYYLNNLSSAHACVPSEEYIENHLQSINNELKEANRDYDAETGHGKTQGAVFNI